MQEIGLFASGNFNKEVYKNVLKLIQEGELSPVKQTKNEIDFSQFKAKTASLFEGQNLLNKLKN